MNKLHYKINAPKNPMAADFELPAPRIGYYILGPEVVSDEFKTYFKDRLNLTVELAVVFPRPQQQSWPGRQNQGVIHSDVTWDNGRWRDLHYAVNYELTPTVSTLSWWETTDEPVYLPTPNPVTHDDLLRGIHYGQRNNFKPLHAGYKRLDSAEIGAEPVLVNTSTPHSVDYAGRAEARYGVSIRFSEQVANWAEAVELFKDIIVE
jgi:hypothetical protein